MALTPQIQVSQAGVASVTEASTSLRVSQVGVFAVAIGPAEFVQASQAGVMAATEASTTLRVSQAGVMIVGRGRVDDPAIKAWRFWLDNHWYYVLRLPTGITLVLDLMTEQWHIWGSGEDSLWRAFHGTNWLGAGPLQGSYGSNVIVGDDGNGALYFLDPDGDLDDDALVGDETPREYLREITGQIAARGIDMIPCFGVHLMGSIGEVLESSLAAVTLYTSDDQGHTYNEHDTLLADPGYYDTRIDWWSLGSFTAPGRLFKVSDHGALKRIDWLEMMDDPDQQRGPGRPRDG